MAFARRDVHAQTRRGVDFYDAVVWTRRQGYVVEDQIDPAYVEPYDSRGAFASRGDLRVDQIGHVSGSPARREVGAFAQVDDLVRLRRVAERQTAPPHEFRHRLVNGDLGERALVVFATRGVAIYGLHQLDDRAFAVSDDVRRDAFARRRHLPVDDQHAIIAPRELSLDHDPSRIPLRDAMRPPYLLRRGQVERDALPLAHVVRLDHDRRADGLQGLDRLVLRLREYSARDFDPGVP